MTQKQRREHKAGNQKRKAILLHLAKHARKPERGYWAKSIFVQDGKFTAH